MGSVHPKFLWGKVSISNILFIQLCFLFENTEVVQTTSEYWLDTDVRRERFVYKPQLQNHGISQCCLVSPLGASCDVFAFSGLDLLPGVGP